MGEANLQDKMYAVTWCSVVVETNPFKMDDEQLDRFLKEENYISLLSDLKTRLAEDASSLLTEISEDYNASFVDIETFGVAEDTINNEKPFIKFPRLILHKSDQNPIEVKITVNPCFGGSPNTKIIAVPKGPEGQCTKQEILEFFKEMKDVLTDICNKICGFYIRIIKDILTSSDRYKFGNLVSKTPNIFYLYSHVIGGDNEGFVKVVQSSEDNSLMEGVIEKYKNLQDSIDILREVRIPQNGSSYRWFTKQIVTDRDDIIENDFAVDGLFGYLRTDKAANFIGLTPHNPRKITKLLMLEAFKSI